MKYLVYRTLGRRRVRHRQFDTLDEAMMYCGSLRYIWVDMDFERWDLEVVIRKEK